MSDTPDMFPAAWELLLTITERSALDLMKVINDSIWSSVLCPVLSTISELIIFSKNLLGFLFLIFRRVSWKDSKLFSILEFFCPLVISSDVFLLSPQLILTSSFFGDIDKPNLR